MQVQDIMTKHVSVCHPDTDAAAAAEIMLNNDIGVLPVVEDGGRPVGVVTDRDLFIALGTRNRRPSEIRVGEVMRTGLSSCAPEDDLRTAMKTMAQQQLRRLPVVDESGVLKGILSMNDIALNAGADGVSSDDVARTLKAVCAHPQDDAKALQKMTSKSKPAVA